MVPRVAAPDNPETVAVGFRRWAGKRRWRFSALVPICKRTRSVSHRQLMLDLPLAGNNLTGWSLVA